MSSYQWYRVDKNTRAFVADIAGATGETYQQVAGDENYIVKVRETINGEMHSSPDTGPYADQVTVAGPPPPPPPGAYGARSLPTGSFTDYTTAQWFRTTAGGSISSKRVTGAPDYGIGIMGTFSPAPPPPSTGIWIVTDVIGKRIGHTPPTMNGTGEAGLWAGQQINLTRGLGDGTWMGGWTGAQCRLSNLYDLTFAILNSDLSLGRLPGIGLYLEHSTRNTIIDGLTIRSTQNGINAEWWYVDSGYAPYVHADLPAAPAGKAGSWNVEIRNFDIDSSSWGIFLDAGSCGFNIHDGIIRGNNGIAHPANLAVSSMPNIIDWATIDFVGSGTKEWVHTHALGTVLPTHADFLKIQAEEELIPGTFRNQPDFWSQVAELHAA